VYPLCTQLLLLVTGAPNVFCNARTWINRVMQRSARAGATATMDLSALLQPLPDWDASPALEEPAQHQPPSDGARTQQRQQPSAGSPTHIIRLHRTGSFEVERVQTSSPSSSRRHILVDERTAMQASADYDEDDAFWHERANNVATMWHTTTAASPSSNAAAATTLQTVDPKQQQQSSLILDAAGTRATQMVNETQPSPQPAASPFETYATGDSHLNNSSVRFGSINGSVLKSTPIDAFGLPSSNGHRQHNDHMYNSQRQSLRSSGNRGTMQPRRDQHELVPALLNAVNAMMASLKHALASDSVQQLNASTATAALDSTTDTASYFLNADTTKGHVHAVQAMCLRAKRNVSCHDDFTQCVIDVSEICCSAVTESINSLQNERQQSAVLLNQCQAQMAQLHIAHQKAVKEAVRQERFNAAAKAASLSKHSSDTEATLQDKLTQLQQQLNSAQQSTDATTHQLRHELAAATALEHELQEQLQRLETEQADTVAQGIRAQKAAMERKAAQDVDTMRAAVQKLREQAEIERQSIRRDANARLAETQRAAQAQNTIWQTKAETAIARANDAEQRLSQLQTRVKSMVAQEVAAVAHANDATLTKLKAREHKLLQQLAIANNAAKHSLDVQQQQQAKMLQQKEQELVSQYKGKAMVLQEEWSQKVSYAESRARRLASEAIRGITATHSSEMFRVGKEVLSLQKEIRRLQHMIPVDYNATTKGTITIAYISPTHKYSNCSTGRNGFAAHVNSSNSYSSGSNNRQAAPSCLSNVRAEDLVLAADNESNSSNDNSMTGADGMHNHHADTAVEDIAAVASQKQSSTTKASSTTAAAAAAAINDADSIHLIEDSATAHTASPKRQ
jgi:hypothetical protein